MEFPAILMASAGIPMIFFNGFWYWKDKEIYEIYGVFSGFFAFSGALLVTFGFPGSLILPGTLGILSLGSFHENITKRDRKISIKTVALMSVLILIIIMEVLL